MLPLDVGRWVRTFCLRSTDEGHGVGSRLSPDQENVIPHASEWFSVEQEAYCEDSCDALAEVMAVIRSV